MGKRKTNRVLPWVVVTAVLAGLAWAFPPVHLRSIKAMNETQEVAGVEGKDLVEQFWRETLLPAARERAADAGEVVRAIAENPRKVSERFGRTVGLSSSYFLFVRGSGTVVSADADAVGLSMTPEGKEADVVVPLGFVFGNAVRDGTGLLDPGRYTNAQEFNDLSAKLNEIVERDVLPEFARVGVMGKRVAFAGCVEVGDEEADLRPLKLVPVYVKAE